MALTFLGTSLVNAIRNIGMVPNTGATGTEAQDLLDHASQGIRAFIVSKLHNTREEYFLVRERSTITAGTSRYRLPHRAMWQKLRALFYFDGTNRQELLPGDPDKPYNLNGTGSVPSRYLIEGNDIQLVPDLSPAFTGYLEFVYYARPGDLVLETAARQVSAVDTTTRTVTFATAIPSDWSTETLFDVHSQYSGAELKGWSLTGAASASQVVFSAAIDGSVFGTKPIQVGDWVCLENEAALPGLPAELHPIVARIACLQLAESIGDQEKANLHGKVLETFLKEQMKGFEQRIESKPWRVRGAGGLLGSRGFFSGRRRLS